VRLVKWLEFILAGVDSNSVTGVRTEGGYKTVFIVGLRREIPVKKKPSNCLLEWQKPEGKNVDIIEK
jgi:hypothetical protein